MSNPIVTIFTITYNKGYTIQYLYESLCAQTSQKFEWLIADQGSVDDTKDMLSNYINENKISIHLLNDGTTKETTKETTKDYPIINEAIKNAKGKLFFFMEADDYLPKAAVERIIKWESSLQTQCKFLGIAGRKAYRDNKIMGNKTKIPYLDATAQERKKYKIIGERAEVYYTEILKTYHFPSYIKEADKWNNYILNEIASDRLKIRWFNEIIYIADYLDESGFYERIRRYLMKLNRRKKLYIE